MTHRSPHPRPRRNHRSARRTATANAGGVEAGIHKLNDVDPQAYLTDVVTRIVQAHTSHDIDGLMPLRFRPNEDTLTAVA